MTESNRADDAGAALEALHEIMAGPAEGPRMQALLDRHGAAILAALETAARCAADPESDWVLVPREPTKEMIQASIWALDRWREKHGNVQGHVPPGEKYQIRWRAMLAAAPAALPAPQTDKTEK